MKTNQETDELLTLVAQQPFFKGMSAHLIQLLSDSIMEMHFNSGDWLFRQRDPANRFYIILEGRVMIESEVKEFGMVPIRTLGPGDDLAWACYFQLIRCILALALLNRSGLSFSMVAVCGRRVKRTTNWAISL